MFNFVDCIHAHCPKRVLFVHSNGNEVFDASQFGNGLSFSLLLTVEHL